MSTTNPVPSNDPSDLLFNAEKLDEVVNGDGETYVDRLGTTRKTVAGELADLRNAASTAISITIPAKVDTVQAAATDAILNDIPAAVASVAAINSRGAWAPLTAYTYRDIVLNAGTWYIIVDPHTSGATFAADAGKWRVYQGVTSGDLAAPGGSALIGHGGSTVAAALALLAGGIGIVLVPSNDATGALDDAAFAAAHAQAVAAGSGLILLAPGTFYTKTPWIVTGSNIGIQALCPGASKIVVAPTWASVVGGGGASIGGVIAFVGVNNFFCRGIEIDAVTNNKSCNGIQNIPTGANGAGTVCTYGEISGNKVRLKPGGNYHIWNLRGRHVKILNNVVDGSTTSYTTPTTQEGIEVYGGYDVLVQGNTVKNIGNNGIYVQSIAVTTPSCELDNIRVLGNHVEKCNAGIFVHPTFDAVNGDAYLKNCIVAENTIVDYWTYGIRTLVTTEGTSLKNLQIFGNTLRGAAPGVSAGQAGSRAIALENQVSSIATVTIRNVEVKNNQSDGCALSDAGAPIYILYFNSLLVADNQSYSVPTAGNVVGLFMLGCEDFEVDGNTFDGARLHSVSLNACFRFSVRRNKLLNFNLAGFGTGALAVNTSGTDFQIEDNVLDTTTVTGGPAAWMNLGTAGLDSFAVRSNRYRNKNGNLGTIATYSFPAGRAWAATTAKARKNVAVSSAGLAADGFYFECVQAGTTGGVQPTWNKQQGALTTDGTVVWAARSIH